MFSPVQHPDWDSDTYENTLFALEQRAARDDFDLDSLKREYEALTIYDGMGWGGRGILRSSELEAQVLAFQVFLRRYAGKD